MAIDRNALSALFVLAVTAIVSAASVVTIDSTAAGWRLLRNGTPCFVKGAGGQNYYDVIVASGGNSIRTWGATDTVLDSAQAHGLTVTMGIWDPATAVAAVNKYRNHGALLMWGLGNEMETRTADPVALWRNCNAVALQMKQADPNHPVMTVVAEISATKIQQIKDNYPALDILGINSYGGLQSLAGRLQAAGWTKPYMVTEFGPLGPWEAAKTAWGVPIEQTSTAKGDFYLKGYQASIGGKPGCLGSYAFLWGYKQEKTHTWMGMFLQPDIGGGRTAAVDAMAFAWTGAFPADRCPAIGAGGVTVDNRYNAGNGAGRFAPKSRIKCRVDASDPEGGPVAIAWDLRKDVSLNPTSGGAPEPVNPPIANAVLTSGGDSSVILLPGQTGYYRVHVYLHDAAGNAATANLPIVVDSTVALGVRRAPARHPTTGMIRMSNGFDAAGRMVRAPKSPIRFRIK